MKRLTLVISALGPGGAERVLSLMANYWSRKGLEVDLITLDSGETAPFFSLESRINHIPLGLARDSVNKLAGLANNLGRVRRIREAILDRKPDTVISFVDRTNILVLIALMGTSVPVIVSERSDPASARLYFPWEHLRRISYRRASRIVVQTGRSNRAFSPYLRRKCSIIPNPIPEPAITHTERSGDPYGVIIGVGRLSSEKGFDKLIKAFGRIARSHLNWRLRIWGDGPERKNLDQIIRQEKLENQVDLMGFTRSPAVEMAKSDIFVLSSRFEGFPNALAEAMACGLPVISFDCPTGPAELIQNEGNGLLVPPDDVDALASALDRLIRSPIERERFGASARLIIQKFGVESVMNSWDETIRAVLS